MFFFSGSSDITNCNYGLLIKISCVIMYCTLLYQDRLTEHFPAYMVLNFYKVIKNWNTKSELSLSNKTKCKSCLVLYYKLLSLGSFWCPKTVYWTFFLDLLGPPISSGPLLYAFSIQNFENLLQKLHLVAAT